MQKTAEPNPYDAQQRPAAEVVGHTAPRRHAQRVKQEECRVDDAHRRVGDGELTHDADVAAADMLHRLKWARKLKPSGEDDSPPPYQFGRLRRLAGVRVVSDPQGQSCLPWSGNLQLADSKPPVARSETGPSLRFGLRLEWTRRALSDSAGSGSGRPSADGRSPLQALRHQRQARRLELLDVRRRNSWTPSARQGDAGRGLGRDRPRQDPAVPGLHDVGAVVRLDLAVGVEDADRAERRRSGSGRRRGWDRPRAPYRRARWQAAHFARRPSPARGSPVSFRAAA